MQLAEVLLGVPEYPDVGHHVHVEQEDEVESPPDLERHLNSQLVIE